MKNDKWLNVDDIPVLCDNVPDYRAEAISQAQKDAKVFGVAYVMYNGVYYYVTSGEHGRIHWRNKGYDVIHTEYSEAAKRAIEAQKG